jgi:hypothetical protein
MKLVDPTIGVSAATGLLATRVETLDDKVVGFICNGYPGAERFLRRVDEIVSEKYKLRGKVWHIKDYIGEPAKPHIQEDVIANCDVIITGLGA